MDSGTIHITGATILDGSGAPPRRGEILLRNGRIAAAAARVSAPRVAERIDAAGLYAAPGFIDVHSHTDLSPFLPASQRLKLRQGITTDLTGLCGFSPAPMPAGRQEGWQRYFIPGTEGANGSWERFGDYLAALRRHGSALNLHPFVGHGTLRYAVKGADPAPLTCEERRRMTALLRQARQEGARGLSLGLIYVPALFAGRSELRVLLSAAAELRMPVTVHMRSESEEMLQALTEMIRLGRESGARIHISHLKTIGRKNRYKMEEALRLIADHRLSFDVYPYTYGSTSLLTLLPPALLRDRAAEEVLAELEQSRMRERVLPYLRGELLPPPGEPWDNLALLAGWDNLELADLPPGPCSRLRGMSIAAAAEELSLSPEETVLHLIARCGGSVRIIDYYTDEQTVMRALRHPAGVFSTDTLLGGRPHPRSAGSFPRILRRCITDPPLLPLEEAVAKMSGRSARLFGLTDRGLIAPGRRADLVLFSPEITDRAGPRSPAEEAEGVRWLFVGGETAVRRGEITGSRSGEVTG